MTRLLEQAIERARALPPQAQDDLARLLMQLTGEEEPASLAKSLAEAEAGAFASEEQVRAIWSKHGL